MTLKYFKLQNMSKKRTDIDRRQFFKTGAIAVGSLAIVGIGAEYLKSKKKDEIPSINFLRPPGAIDENIFVSECIKCGLCVQICPIQAIKLADIDSGLDYGTPYIEVRSQACDFSCDAVQCVLACPTGSLSHTIVKKEDVRMGLARVAKPEACLASQGLGFKGLARGADFNGLLRYAKIDRWNPIPVREHPYDLELCDLCVRECPIENAISLQSIDNEGKRKMPVIKEACVGCGVCEMMCPVEPSVIVIDERKMWGKA